eukprot:4173768-Pyramimonas_sp.AAC.1
MPAGGARSFVPQKAEKKTAGRQAWKAGEKCHEFSVLHKRADFIKKYADQVQFDGDASSAAYSCLGRPA